MKIWSKYRLHNLLKTFKELAERNYKLGRNEQEELEYQRITKKSEAKKIQLLEFSPAFCYQMRFAENGVYLTELIFNEPYLHELGYSLNSFVTAVFQEGLPQ